MRSEKFPSLEDVVVVAAAVVAATVGNASKFGVANVEESKERSPKQEHLLSGSGDRTAGVIQKRPWPELLLVVEQL